jgi:hypothetical protein
MTFIEKQNAALEQLDSIVKPQSMPADVLAAIGAEARRLGRPLLPEEVASVYSRFD